MSVSLVGKYLASLLFNKKQPLAFTSASSRRGARSKGTLWTAGAALTAVGLCTATRGVPWVGIAKAASVHAASETTGKAFARRLCHGHRLEPHLQVVLQGGGPVDEASFSGYAAALAPKAPMLSSTTVDLHDDLPGFFHRLRHDLERADAGGNSQGLVIPEIGVTLNAGDASEHYEDLVAKGGDDRRIVQLLAGVRSLERPVFLRLGYGFNETSTGYEPRAYVAAFRRVAQAVRAAGMDQVALVWEWSPDAELELEEAGAREGEASARWRSFYPGDDVVDWWGIDLYSQPGITGPATADFLAEAERHGFPVSVGDSTPKGHDAGESGLLLDAWYKPFFDLIAGSPAVKAFTYIDRNWREYPQWTTWGDARVEADPLVLGFVREHVSRPVYAGRQPRAATERLLGLAPAPSVDASAE